MLSVDFLDFIQPVQAIAPLALLGLLGLGSAAVNTVGNLISNSQNAGFNDRMFEKQMRYNTGERVAAQGYNTSERVAQQQFAQGMLNDVRQYETPTNQLQRFMDAGINPNAAVQLIQGGTISSGPTSSAGSISPASANPMGSTVFANPFGNIADSLQLVANLRKTMAEAEGEEIDNLYKDEANQLSNDQQRIAIREARADIAYKKAMTGLTESQRARYDELQDLAISEGQARIGQILQSMDEVEATIGLIEEQKKTESRRRQSMDASDAASFASAEASEAAAAASRSSAGLMDAQAETVNQSRGLQLESLDRDVANKYLQGKISKQQLHKEIYENKLRQNNINPNGGLTGQIGYMLQQAHDAGSSTSYIIRSTLRSASRSIGVASHHRNVWQKRYGKQ